MQIKTHHLQNSNYVVWSPRTIFQTYYFLERSQPIYKEAEMLKRTNPTLSEGQDTGDRINDLDELIKADVRGHLRNYGDWKKLAQDTGINYQTIANFAYGVTQNPQQRTLTRLMEGMGYGEQLRQAYYSAEPITTAQALKKAPTGVRTRYKKLQAAKAQAAARKTTQEKKGK